MTADGASMSKASALSETIADEILAGATYRNTELWDEYPEYHDLSYTVNKDGTAKAELVKRYGTWSEAVAEARRHGVKLRQAEGVRDGNPAEEYEAIVNDTRSMGGTKQGAAELFRGAAKAAGVDGAASMESTEWLDVLMNVHDTINHTHTVSSLGGTSQGIYYTGSDTGWASLATKTTSSAGAHTHSVTIGNTGSGQAFSILNPYVGKYVWRRVS